MIAAAIVATMWVWAFGLSHEYAMPVWQGALPSTDYDNNLDEAVNQDDDDYNNDDAHEDLADTALYIPGVINPSFFPDGEAVIFSLTEEASMDGARLRDGPGTIDTIVIEMLFGHDLLIYLGHYTHDPDLETLFWLRVRTPSGMEGYIASQLLEIAG